MRAFLRLPQPRRHWPNRASFTGRQRPLAEIGFAGERRACILILLFSTGANVRPDSSYEWRRQVMWGLLLIAFGGGVFLDQMDLIEVHGVWHYWPLVLVVFGVNKMIGYPTAKHFTSGLWLVFLGLWIFAVFEGMFGLTWGNSWPFPIIACGVTMVLEPIIKSRFGANEEFENEK
jgi:hypothetical protein